MGTFETDVEAAGKLGARIARHRLRRALTQRELALRAGVSTTALQRLEHGQNSTTYTLLAVLRELALLDVVIGALPEMTGPTPMELLKHARPERQRAPRRRRNPRG